MKRKEKRRKQNPRMKIGPSVFWAWPKVYNCLGKGHLTGHDGWMGVAAEVV